MKAAASPYAPGYVIAGKYELEEELGQGGMGVVWRARNIALDSQVAIKVVRATSDKALLRGRLVQEARAAAKLAHPAIVTVFDVGQTESGDPFIVMELLRGDSLGKLLETQGRLPAVQAVRSLLPIADALWLAHGKGIVHRDLKPDNVFIVQHDGAIQPTLVDFGIVKLQDADDAQGSLTKDGDILGSPDYMSPEQARGQDDVTHLTDLWSFCVVLYEAIAGRTPFKGANYNALLRQIVEDTPPTLRELASGDDELSAIVARGLSKKPEDRFASMGELGRTLAKWLVKQGVTEDICGTTLEAKWLRGTDPHGRAGMPSLSDAWLNERSSGVRRNEAGPFTTMPAPARGVLTNPAESEAALALGRRPDVRSKWVWVGVTALVLGLAGFGMAKSLLAPAAVARQSAATQGPIVVAPAAQPVAPAPVPIAALPEEGAPATPDAEKRARPVPDKVSSSSARASGAGRGVKSVAPKRSPSPARPKAKPGGDLMSPY